ncbi:MAG: lantibiotic dehydratase, partial [bacterium]
MTHAVPLDAGWSLWSWACLRAPGFPAHMVLELADGELATAADRWLDHEAAAARARETLITECKAALERLSGDAQRSVRRALKQLWQHRVPESIGDDATEPARRRLADAVAVLEREGAELAEHHARARRRTSEALRRVGADDRFRQAVLWQNRSAIATGIDWLLRQPITATDNQTRKNERLIASYLQRYCVKNDTIGFFGPVGWARFVDRTGDGDGDGTGEADGGGFAQRPGPDLIAERTVYFEY